MPSTNHSLETTSTGKVEIARQIFEEHGDFIHKIIQFHINNKQEAEDLFQDMFLFLVSKPLPQDVRNVKSFLYRIITARAIDKIRHKIRVKALTERYSKSGRRLTEYYQDDHLVKEEKTKEIFTLVKNMLPHNEAKAITLRYKEELSVDQTARKMEVKSRTVSRYVSLGISKLRCIVKNKEGINHET